MQRKQDDKPRGRLFGGLLIALAVAIWLVWWQWGLQRDVEQAAELEPVADAVDTAVEPGDAGDEPSRERLAWTALTGEEPIWPTDLDEPSDCRAVEAELGRLCRVLDSREYVREAGVPGGVCALLSTVAEALAARPPALSSELLSYESILSNVFHLFRTVGRPRLRLLRRAIAEEGPLAEPFSLALYRWAASRQHCARSGRTPITDEAMAGYSAFLFQTLGGQAYLRRRSPRVEALTSFYALRILDRSDAAGHNPWGLDARPEIARARALIAGQPLVFRERYLEALDEMERRWSRRAEKD